MRDDKERVSSFEAATPQPGWNSFDDRPATPAGGALSDESENSQTQKKPYGKPTYRFERVFETMALSCGKISATQFQCRFHRHSS